MTIWVLHPSEQQVPVTTAEVQRLPAVTVLEDGAIAVHWDLSEERRAWLRRRAVGIATQLRGNR